jgi:hypothetical protein
MEAYSVLSSLLSSKYFLTLFHAFCCKSGLVSGIPFANSYKSRIGLRLVLLFFIQSPSINACMFYSSISPEIAINCYRYFIFKAYKVLRVFHLSNE